MTTQAQNGKPDPLAARLNRRLLHAGVAGVFLIVIVAALLSLNYLRGEAQRRAESATQNLASSMEQNLGGIISVIDVVLQASADELTRQTAAGHPDSRVIEDFFEKQRERAPLLHHLRAADAQGTVQYGKEIGSSPPSIAERDFFLHLRNNPGAGLVIAKPVRGQITGEWIWLMARRYAKPDRSFGGVVYASIFINDLNKLLAQVDLPPNSLVALRDRNLRLIARNMHGELNIPVSDQRLSDAFKSALGINPQAGSFVGSCMVDEGLNRIFSYRRNARHGFTVLVGINDAEAFAEWRKQVWGIGSFAVLFMLAAAGFTLLINHAWRRQEDAVAALEIHRESLQEAQRVAHLGHFTYDLHNDKWTGSEVLDDIFGIPPGYPHDVEHWMKLVAADCREEVRAYFVNAIKLNLALDREFHIVRPSDGQERWIYCGGHVQLDSQGKPVTLFGIFQDITERKEMETALGQSEARFRLMFEHNDAVMLLIEPETGEIMDANAAAAEFYDYPIAHLREMRISQISMLPPEEVAQNLTRVRRHERNFFIVPHRLANGETRIVETYSSPIEVGGRQALFSIIHDVTERQHREDMVLHQALYDELTNLPNRRLLSDRLNQVMAANRRSGCYGAVMFLDLDNFKPLNDRHGHETGDMLLVEAGERLRNCVREMDTVARFGGDEFVVMISELYPDKAESAAQAKLIAEKIRSKLSEPYRLTVLADGGSTTVIEHRCTTSIGVALFINHETSQDEIINQADKAMYQAKQSGRNSIRFHDAKD